MGKKEDIKNFGVLFSQVIWGKNKKNKKGSVRIHEAYSRSTDQEKGGYKLNDIAIVTLVKRIKWTTGADWLVSCYSVCTECNCLRTLLAIFDIENVDEY